MIQSNRELLASTAEAMAFHICVLNPAGEIVAVNHAWNTFASANDGHTDTGSDYYLGRNYLAICEAAQDETIQDAQPVAQGIRSVLRGELREFRHSYPCHSPTEERWFSVRVSPLNDSAGHVAVSHVEISSAQSVPADSSSREDKLKRL